MDSSMEMDAGGGRNSRGQSLVEVALFLPLLIVMLAGLVEVANLLVTQNKVSTASRIAAGYGATYLTDEDRANWSTGPIADAMGVTALNAVTETLELDEDLWDIWSMYGKTNADGTGWAQDPTSGQDIFYHKQVYGNNQVVTVAEWDGMQEQIKADVLAELQAVAGADASDLEVVAAADFHNIDTILGLPVWQWVGAQRIRGLTVMRVSEVEDYTGCPILPITVRLEQYSLYPSNWPDGPVESGGWGEYLRNGDGTPKFPADPIDEVFGPPHSEPPNLFPTNAWDYPPVGSRPVYENDPSAPLGELDTDTFLANVPGVPMTTAFPAVGFIYKAREEGPAGNFGWLSWDDVNAATDLSTSLTFPGDFLLKYPNSEFDLGTEPDPPNVDVAPFDEAEGDGNHMLEPGEWVANSTGNSNASGVRAALRFYVDTGTPVVLPVYDYTNGGATGSNSAYHVFGFVKARLLGYNVTGTPIDRWILFEVLGWGIDCVSPTE